MAGAKWPRDKRAGEMIRHWPRLSLVPCVLLLSVALGVTGCSQSSQSSSRPEPLNTCILGHWRFDAEASSSSLLNPESEYSLVIEGSTITSNVFTPDTLDPQSDPTTLVMTGALGEVTMEYELDGSTLVIGREVSMSGVLDRSRGQATEDHWQSAMAPGNRIAATCEGNRLTLSPTDGSSVTFAFVGGDDSPTVISPGKDNG